jgi:hypothetical protein
MTTPKAVKITFSNSAAVSAALFSLATVLPSRAANTAPPVPSSNNETIVLDKLTVKGVRERVNVYQAKADNLFDGLRAEKKVRYSTVILSSYDTSKFDLVEALVAKKKYRETTAKDHRFFCNYAAINMDVPVYFEMYDEARTVLGAHGTSGSMYLFKKKKIQIQRGGDKTKIYHAAGAALSGFIAPENKPIIKELGKNKKDVVFVRQVNFEVRLQDLNRFHAMLTEGRPIMTPLDAVRAIVSMGETLKKEMVEQILLRNHVVFKTEDLDKALAAPEYTKDGKDPTDNGGPHSAFTIARRLVGGMRDMEMDDAFGGGGGLSTVEPGLELISGKAYEDYLERILIEAPGHI